MKVKTLIYQLKQKIKEKAFKSPYGILFFYRLRIIREKLSLARFSDETYITTTYKKRYGRDLNFKNPETYTEKLQWLKFFYRNSEMPVCTDKYTVRQYLTEHGYSYLLNSLIGVYNNANDIDFASLPDRFVAKANHGSSWNLICNDKNKLNWPVWRKIMNTWLKLNLFVIGREWNYKYIPPRIIIEEFIEHEPLIDYKFMCFNGEPKFIQINSKLKGEQYMDLYDINWNKMDSTYKYYIRSEGILDKPPKFKKMIELAKKISSPFPFVRVDFYNFNEKIIFGEMTFFPGSGLIPLIPAENKFDELLGSHLELPTPNHNLDLYKKVTAEPG